MPKKILLRLFVFIFLISFYGCQTSKVHVRGYIEDKPRVDLARSGNAGYLLGAPKEQKEEKPTRKVFVVEVFAKNETPTGLKGENREYQKNISEDLLREPLKRAKQTPPPSEDFDLNLPFFDDEEYVVKHVASPKEKIASFNPTSFVDYTVEKNDTLQKISKKFYGSFSKWHRIYDANKEQIKDPNRIKPGIIIQVPVE